MKCSRCQQDKELEAFGLNRSKASGRQSYCKPCAKSYQKQLPAEIKTKKLERSKAWQRANPDRVSKINAKHFQKRKKIARPADRARQNEWRKENPEKNAASRARHYRRQKARYLAAVGYRRAALRQAVPCWYDEAAVKAVYAEATARNAAGECVHVDHVIPLVSKVVCGLHVHTNLEIIPAVENLSKNNRHWPDMP